MTTMPPSAPAENPPATAGGAPEVPRTRQPVTVPLPVPPQATCVHAPSDRFGRSSIAGAIIVVLSCALLLSLCSVYVLATRSASAANSPGGRCRPVPLPAPEPLEGSDPWESTIRTPIHPNNRESIGRSPGDIRVLPQPRRYMQISMPR
ncbi:hypothetical protein [Streptomyces sp. NBC_00829]|uniref:hypothetical protein n=1 Tax=Streptomyces sp. NBC_00829 TaxID=2903679 RepID=UPI00386CAC70|nr:hypothetical protein OG293_02135 [Streptomyces sp. NBC_00829]